MRTIVTGPFLSWLLQGVRAEWITPIKKQIWARYPELKNHDHPGTVALPREMEIGIRRIIQDYATT